MKKLKDILSYSINITDDIHLDVKTILFVILVFFFTGLFLKLFKKIVNRKLDEENKGKFKAVFSFIKYFVYSIVFIIALESSGIKLSVLLAGSAALLVGIGLGLQTLFQDIMSGIFILVVFWSFSTFNTLNLTKIICSVQKCNKMVSLLVGAPTPSLPP